jgi:hypothetical protein
MTGTEIPLGGGNMSSLAPWNLVIGDRQRAFIEAP